MYHTVEVQPGVERSFSDVRGLYNVITRRFTDLTQWTHYPNANTQVVLNNIAPVGCVTELMFLAVPHQAVASDRRCHQYIKATMFQFPTIMLSKIRTKSVPNYGPTGSSPPMPVSPVLHDYALRLTVLRI